MTYNPAAKWIGDGSDGCSLDVTTSTASSTIKFASATQGTPFNIRLSTDDFPLGRSYYEVQVTELSQGASLGVGLVTADGFRPGWKTKGCFYNGNVTNGSAGLIIGFGKRVNKGDVVGVYHQSSAGQCNIIFYHNGRCLGAGFAFDHDEERYYPCLHLSGSASVEFSIPPSPTVFEREQAVHEDSYSGDWAIEKAFEGPELGELPLPDGSTFKVSIEKSGADSGEGGAVYHISVKISNSFSTSLVITGKLEAFDKIELSGPCMSTRMMPRPQFQKMERFIGSALDGDGGFRKMIVTEEGKLIMSGPTAEIICTRYVETFEPVRSIK